MEIDENIIIENSIERLKKIKKKMDLPSRYTEEEALYVFEEVNHDVRSRQISADKDRRMEKIAQENKIGKDFEKEKQVKQQENKQNNSEEENNKKEKKKLEYKHKYKFSQKPGHATNKQLSFIQELREKNEEKILEIEVDVENVPKMSFDDANKEIRRLKKELGWKQKEKDQG